MLATSATQRLLLLVLVMLLAAIGVILLTDRNPSETRTVPGSHSRFDGPLMPPGLVAKDFTLTDQNGRLVTLSSYRGHVVVLTFIHSLCQDDCPFMVEQIKGALDNMPESGQGIPAIGVSVAPREDTVAHRRTFLALHRMSARLAFLNGPSATVKRVWHDFAIAPGTGRQGHSAFVLLIDKKGIERVGFAAAQLTPEALAHDLRVLEAEPA